MICRILEKNFCGLGSWQISAAHYCARGPMTRLFTTTLIMVNYYPITATYLSTYILPAALLICICNIYIMIYICICIYVYVCVMLWCAMCRMVYVYATLSSLALSSQPVCAWVGWHRCLTVCTYAHIVQTIASHLLSLLLLLLYILYNIYTTTIHIPNMIFVYIILCHVKRLCYTPTLVYITLCYTMYIYTLSHYDMIYDYVHNLTYYINIL